MIRVANLRSYLREESLPRYATQASTAPGQLRGDDGR